MKKVQQIEKVIGSLEQAVEKVKQQEVAPVVIQELVAVACDINLYLYHSRFLKIQSCYAVNSAEDISQAVNELERLVDIWQKTLCVRKTNIVDSTFWDIYEYFKYVDEETIYQDIINHFKSMPKENQELYSSLKIRYPFLKNTIDSEKNDFSLVKECLDLVVEHLEDFKWLHEHLADYRSKAVLSGVIRYWFDFDLQKLHEMRENVFSDYYDLDIVSVETEAVVVDLGAYTGDSAVSYADTYNEYKKIYAYEITPSTFECLKENVAAYPGIIPVNKGVAAVPGIMYVRGEELGVGNSLQADGEIAVEVVSLDEDIQEPINVIKMDIEGAEKDAIIGARRHIAGEKPKLLISLYHLQEDIIEIPKLIYSIREDYKFYLRYNGGNGIWPCDYILIAV